MMLLNSQLLRCLLFFKLTVKNKIDFSLCNRDFHLDSWLKTDRRRLLNISEGLCETVSGLGILT